MKNISKRKLVLNSIGAFTGLMLFIGLCFTVVGYDLGVSGASAAGMSANGYDMLGFDFPVVVKSLMMSWHYDEAIYSTFGAIFGVLSLLTLLAAICGLAINVVSIFFFDEAKSARFGKISVILGVALTAVYAIAAIVFTAVISSGSENMLGGLTTSAYISTIFQIAICVAYVVCAKKIQGTGEEDEDFEEYEEEIEEALGAQKQEQKENEVTLEEDKSTKSKKTKEYYAEKLKSVISGEKYVIQLLVEYKKSYDDSVLSSLDYADKKVALFRYAGQRIKTEVAPLVSKCDFADVIKTEFEVIGVLKEYKKLLDDGVISNADFSDKKGELLGCIVSIKRAASDSAEE